VKGIKMFTVKNFDIESEVYFDFFIAGYGFEERSPHISKLISRKIGQGYYIGYSENDKLLHENLTKNREIFSDLNFIANPSIDEGGFEDWADQFFQNIIDSTGLVVGIDISCLSRYRLAIIVKLTPNLLIAKKRVIFVYNLAEFNEPKDPRDQLVSFSPISPDFTGWSRNHINAPRVVFGLGFEKNRIQVALEELQSSDVFFFMPTSPLNEYTEWVKSGNEIAFSSDFANNILEYNVLEPKQTFNYMESLIDFRLDFIIVPFGPKIFALLALLLSLKHNLEIGVWRVSPSDFDPDIDRKPSKLIVGLEIVPSNSNL
jgi:hypothetical protein